MSAAKAVAREKGTWWPEVDFVYTSQYSDVGFDNLTSTAKIVRELRDFCAIPNFEGGAKSARLGERGLKFILHSKNWRAITRLASGRARQAWVNLDNSCRA